MAHDGNKGGEWVLYGGEWVLYGGGGCCIKRCLHIVAKVFMEVG